MIETFIVHFTEEEIKELINMLENGNFKGINWRKIGNMIESLKRGLDDKEINNSNRD